MYGTAYPPYEGTREEERDGDSRLDEEMGLQEQAENPPYAGRTPTTLTYIHQYDIE